MANIDKVTINGTDYKLIDSTVPSWAKQSTKPSYTANEVGAVPTTRTVNGKALSSNITLSASDVGADIFVVNIESDGNDGYTCDKTNAEIYAAWQAGRDILLIKDSEFLYKLIASPSLDSCVFGGVDYDDFEFISEYTISTSNNVQRVFESYTQHQRKLVSGTNIKTINSESILGNGNIIIGSKIYVGRCNTQASQSTKVVTTESFPTSGGKPLTGTLIAVFFLDTDTSSSNYTYLNVNSTGAIRIMYGNGLFASGKNIRYTGISNVYTIYMYNGTYWRWITTALEKTALSGFGYATQNNSSTSSSITATLSNYQQTEGGIVCVKFTYDVPANSTLNINNAGARSIKHKGSNITAGIIKAGDLVTFVFYNNEYQILAIDSSYTKAEIDSMIGNIETLLASI